MTDAILYLTTNVMQTEETFLNSAKKQFLYYKAIGEKAMEQLEPEQLFFAVNEDTNSISVIVNHLHGNMLSRWTDFLTSDGEKEWRNRDTEFEEQAPGLNARGASFAEAKTLLLQKWHEGWDCLLNGINDLKPEQLSETIYIRNEGHSVVEAINRQLAHYPYHVGQIVFYAKMLKKEAWISLSIPKNKSGEYNSDKFSKEKSLRHFTDDELNRLK